MVIRLYDALGIGIFAVCYYFSVSFFVYINSRVNSLSGRRHFLPFRSLSAQKWIKCAFGAKNKLVPHSDPRVQRTLKVLDDLNKFAVKWKLFVLESKGYFAYSSSGGCVSISTSFLASLKQDSHLAHVLAHEMAHELLNHRTEKTGALLMPWILVAPFVVSLIWIKKLTFALTASIVFTALSLDTVVILTFGRLIELEADKIGFILAADAGFSPDEIVRFFKSQAETKEKKWRNLLLPGHKLRYQRIKSLSAKINIS